MSHVESREQPMSGGRDVIVLGLGGQNHDFSAALAINGEIVVAISEERLTREKYSVDVDRMRTEYASMEELVQETAAWNEYLLNKAPLARSVEYVLAAAGVRIEQLDAVAHCCLRGVIPDSLAEIPRLRINHHRAHAASSYLASPFEDAVVLVADGAGDRIFGSSELESISAFHGRGQQLDLVWQLGDPHSLGGLYEAATRLVGFRSLEEGKTMALASFGTDRYYRAVRDLVTPHDDGRYVLCGLLLEPQRIPDRPRKEQLLKEACQLPDELSWQDRADLAYALQRITEELFLHATQRLTHKVGSTKLCIAGGVALNSVANFKTLREGPIDDIYIQPHAGDGGLAVGGALLATEHVAPGRFPRTVMRHAYLGRCYPEDRVRQATERFSDQIVATRLDDVARHAARSLADGKIIGWFQGGSEWGPRALGNRSILGDPRTTKTKQRLDERIKRRERFRPYAPVVAEDRVGEFFELDRASPFMLLVANIREDKIPDLPAVTHVDGTGRLQTVNRESNPCFSELLAEFESITGVPVILNTSFNINREPIVETPEDAIRTFLGSEMDELILGTYLVRRAGITGGIGQS